MADTSATNDILGIFKLQSDISLKTGDDLIKVTLDMWTKAPFYMAMYTIASALLGVAAMSRVNFLHGVTNSLLSNEFKTAIRNGSLDKKRVN